MFKFRDILKKDTPPPVTDVERSIQETEQSLAMARENLKSEQARKREAQLNDDANAVAASKNKASALEDEVEKLEVVLPALKDRLVEAHKVEAAQGLERKLKAADQASKKGVRLIKQYAEHAASIREIMIELSAIEQAVNQANTLAQEAGEPKRVKSPNFIARGKEDEVVPAQTKRVGGKPAWNDQFRQGTGKPGETTPVRNVQVPETVKPGFERSPLPQTVVIPAGDDNHLMLWAGGRLSANVQGWEGLHTLIEQKAADILA